MVLIPWEQLDWPLDFAALFGRTAPRVLEIGYGDGDFLVQLAREHPDRDYLGLEISWASTQRLLRKTKRHRIRNVRALQGDAAFLLKKVLPADCLAEVFINFSDPWPKPKHHRRRVIQTGFLEALSSRMEPGALLTLATDHADYAEWIADTLENQPWFRNTQAVTRVHTIPGRIPTRYEQKALEADLPIHYFIWEKLAGAAPSERTPWNKVPKMPNMIFQGRIDPGDLLLTEPILLTEENKGEQVHIKFMGSYRNAVDGSWVVETLVQEADFSQHFGFLFSERSAGRWVLKLSSMGSPRPTWGVKRALERLGAWIWERRPDLVPVKAAPDGSKAIDPIHVQP